MALATTAFAQAETSMQGTVYLRGGEQVSGIIKVAEMGVMDGTGIGTDLANNGAIAVKTASGATERIPAENIATVEATWEEVKEDNITRWQITQLAVTKRDGTQVSGVPNWFMHATSVSVEQPDGKVIRMHAYPHSKDFSPENLLKKIELAEAPAAPEPTKPEPEPEEAKPAAEETQPEPAKPEEAAEEEKPTPTAPEEEVKTPEPTVEITPRPEAEEEAHAPKVSEVHVLPSQDVVITLTCPNCGETITLLLRVSALQGIATGASGVQVAPIEPVQ